MPHSKNNTREKEYLVDLEIYWEEKEVEGEEEEEEYWVVQEEKLQQVCNYSSPDQRSRICNILWFVRFNMYTSINIHSFHCKLNLIKKIF